MRCEPKTNTSGSYKNNYGKADKEIKDLQVSNTSYSLQHTRPSMPF